MSKEKAKSLGIEFVPLDISLKETVESLKEKSFISFWVVHYMQLGIWNKVSDMVKQVLV